MNVGFEDLRDLGLYLSLETITVQSRGHYVTHRKLKVSSCQLKKKLFLFLMVVRIK